MDDGARGKQQHTFPYEARTQAEIIRMLEAEGVRFRTFGCISEGQYSPQDAAWNYMDIPHLTYVHKQVDGVLTFAADAVTASVFLQRIPLMRLPLTVMTYQTAPNAVTYYTSFAFYVLVIETTWDAVDATHTRVSTTYAVGWTNKLAGMFYPLLEKLLKRNYRILMSEDIPMRAQRGELRQRGYEFRMSGDVPSFIESKKIMQANVVTPEQNVIAPRASPGWGRKCLAYDELVEGEPLFIGSADHLGLAIMKRGSSIQIFPRLCPHEGAALDDAARKCAKDLEANCVVQCPWHGRRFKPILSFSLPSHRMIYETSWHRFDVSPHDLTVTCNTVEGDSLRNADWTAAAALR